MHILVLIQKQTNREMVVQSLATSGHDVVVTNTIEEAFDLLQASPFEVVISDIEHETLDDEPLSSRLTQKYPDLQVIISTTSLTNLNEAISTLRKGGFSFLVKTFEDAGLISATLSRAIDNVRVLSDLRTRIEELQKNNRELSNFNKSLKNLEVRDALTGLHGHLYFQESLGKELIRSLQYKSPFSLLLMAVRFFTDGHDQAQSIADERVAQLAQALKGRLRRSDLITFYREQTFGFLLPETSKDAGQYVIRTLVDLLEHFPFVAKSSSPMKVVVSFGLSSFPVDGSSISSLMLEAERELMLSIDSGGVTIDQHETSHQVTGTPPVDVLNHEEAPVRRVLVVDDDSSTCALISLVLADNGFEVSIANDGEDALSQFQEKPYPLVISDVIMPGMSGMELMKQIKNIQPEAEVIIMTSHSNLTSPINAMRAGAFDFVTKPIEDLDIIPLIADRAFNNFFQVTNKQRLIAELERKNKGMSIANKSLQNMVIRDGLTGLYNHSHFKEAMEIELVRSKRYQREFSVLFMDLDNFKDYNDAHGHPTGDQLLKTLAKLIGERLRKSDILARYGGEEFTAILPELSKGEAIRVAEGIRREVQNFPFPGREFQPGGRVSITIGIAAFPEDGETANELIHNADQALYRGKNNGRNCISV